MSIFINTDFSPSFTYADKAKNYAILNSENLLMCKINYGTYELKRDEKLIAIFDYEMSLEEYLDEIDYKPDSFFKEITDDKVVLSQEEKLIFEDIKSRILKSFVESYLEERKDLDLDFIEIKLKRINLKINDLEKVNDDIYKLNPMVGAFLITELKLDKYALDNFELETKKLEEVYLSDWIDWILGENNYYKNQQCFKIGFVYTYNKIKYCTLNNNVEYEQFTDESAYRCVDNKYIKIKSNSPFMNLGDCLKIKLNENIYQVHCSCEVA